MLFKEEQKDLLKQTDFQTNKPSFLINQRRKGNLTTNKIYNHFLKIVLREYIPGEHPGIFFTTFKELKEKQALKKITHDDIKRYIKDLRDTSLEQLDDYDLKDRCEYQFSILGSVSYLPKGYIQFSMDQLFLNHLKEIKENQRNLIYAALEDEYIKNFSCKHTLKFYEYFISHQYKKFLEVSVDTLKQLIDIDSKSSYDLLSNFKNKILIPVIEEIEFKTNLEIDYEICKSIQDVKLVDMVKFSIRVVKCELLTPKQFKNSFIFWWREKLLNEPIKIKNDKVKLNKNDYLVREINKPLNRFQSQAIKDEIEYFEEEYTNIESKYYKCADIKNRIEQKKQDLTQSHLSFTQFDKATGVNVWAYLYSKYKANDESIYKLFDIAQSEFELCEYHNDENIVFESNDFPF
ncbi:MAG: replication initiation protein [Campylobacterota bacterium]|nr:replication initiation protein [Campylobacterota bacterium]